MTIEIRQLVIRAVADARAVDPPRRDHPLDPSPVARRETSATPDPGERDELVAACTREVLWALKRARER